MSAAELDKFASTKRLPLDAASRRAADAIVVDVAPHVKVFETVYDAAPSREEGPV